MIGDETLDKVGAFNSSAARAQPARSDDHARAPGAGGVRAVASAMRRPRRPTAPPSTLHHRPSRHSTRPIATAAASDRRSPAAQAHGWRFRAPDAGGQFRRQQPLVRRRDCQRADGRAIGEEALSETRASRLHRSPAVANQHNDLVRGRQPASLLLGIDFLPVNENVQRAWPAQADASGNLQLAFDALFQAHGLHLDVLSKETALDFDVHSGLVKILPRTSTNQFISTGHFDDAETLASEALQIAGYGSGLENEIKGQLDEIRSQRGERQLKPRRSTISTSRLMRPMFCGLSPPRIRPLHLLISGLALALVLAVSPLLINVNPAARQLSIGGPRNENDTNDRRPDQPATGSAGDPWMPVVEAVPLTPSQGPLPSPIKLTTARVQPRPPAQQDQSDLADAEVGQQ